MIESKVVIDDLNYNFECDWLIELSAFKLTANKLSNNKLVDNNFSWHMN